MRQLLPHSPDGEVDPVLAYAVDRPRLDGRPWVASLMVASSDGAAAIAGRSGSLGGAGDLAVFRAVRAVADALVVGAGTVRAEDYGPARTPQEGRADRADRGQTPHPQLVVVSGRLDLDPGQRLFTEADGTTPTPLVVHPPSASVPARRRLDRVAELVEVDGAADGGVDPHALLALLGDRGIDLVVCEGGPSLNGTLLAADLLDEMCLTIDPDMVGGVAPRIVASPGPGELSSWHPAHLLEQDGVLFWRLLRDR